MKKLIVSLAAVLAVATGVSAMDTSMCVTLGKTYRWVIESREAGVPLSAMIKQVERKCAEADLDLNSEGCGVMKKVIEAAFALPDRVSGEAAEKLALSTCLKE